MIYELKVVFRQCEELGTCWDMVDSIRALTDEECKDIQDKLMEHTGSSGITWGQEAIFTDGSSCVRRRFIKIPDKILEVENTPLTKTVYVQMEELPSALRQAILNGKARYEI